MSKRMQLRWGSPLAPPRLNCPLPRPLIAWKPAPPRLEKPCRRSKSSRPNSKWVKVLLRFFASQVSCASHRYFSALVELRRSPLKASAVTADLGCLADDQLFGWNCLAADLLKKFKFGNEVLMSFRNNAHHLLSDFARVRLNHLASGSFYC